MKNKSIKKNKHNLAGNSLESKEYLDARNKTNPHRDGNATQSDVDIANKLLEPDSNSLDRG